MEASVKWEDKNEDESNMNVLLCEYCERGNDLTTKAEGMCLQCEEYLCLTCFNQHLRGKKNRDHELVDVTEDEIKARKSAEEVEKCKQHIGKRIGFYCRRHDCVGCESCIMADHHECKPENISAVSRNFDESDEFVDLKKKLNQVDVCNKKLAQCLQTNKREFKDIQDKLLNEIRGFRKIINAYLDDAESIVKTEVNQLLSFNKDLLENLEKDCKSLTSKLKTLREKLDTATYKEESLFIQTVQSKYVVSELERQLSKCNHSVLKMKHYNYDFIPDEKLKDMLSSRGKLGDIKPSLMKHPTKKTGYDGKFQ